LDSHGGAMVQCRAHRLMKKVQGFPSGNYSLLIAPAAASATANKTTMQNVSTLLTTLMAMAVRRYDTVRIT